MRTTQLLPSRGRKTDSHFLMTPDNFVPNALPFLERTVVRVLATPRWQGTRFGQYLLEMESGAQTTRPIGRESESFLFQIDGKLTVQSSDGQEVLDPGAFCYLPAGAGFSLLASGARPARMLWTKRAYEPVEGLPSPRPILGHHSDIPDIAPEPPATYVYRELIPSAAREYDMAMNILIADPGGSIGQIEMHHQEHGLLMLSGQGIYYLDGSTYEVFAGDYIYMAPYCPQAFFATGEETASYLLYKDINRDGF